MENNEIYLMKCLNKLRHHDNFSFWRFFIANFKIKTSRGRNLGFGHPRLATVRVNRFLRLLFLFFLSRLLAWRRLRNIFHLPYKSLR